MLTPEEVRHVAMLARLGLSDDEVESMREKLTQVLDYINMLDQIDTSQIPPTAQILSHLNVTREDKIVESLPTEAVLANAPGAEGAFFRIPAVLEEFKPKSDTSGSEGADA